MFQTTNMENPPWAPQPPLLPILTKQTTTTLSHMNPKITTEYRDNFCPGIRLKGIGNVHAIKQMENSQWAPKPPEQPKNSTCNNPVRFLVKTVSFKLDSEGLDATNSDSKADRLQESRVQVAANSKTVQKIQEPVTSYRAAYGNPPALPRIPESFRGRRLRIMEYNIGLTAQNRASYQQMKATEAPSVPSFLPSIFKTTNASKDATRKHETSKQCVWDNQDATKEEQAKQALREMTDEERRAVLESIFADHFCFSRQYVIQEKELKEKAEGHSIADELWAELLADKLFWEEVKLKVQTKMEEHMKMLEDNNNLAAQNCAHLQQMKTNEFPFKPSNLPPISKTTFSAKDAAMKLEKSQQFVWDNQDATKEEQAKQALMDMTDEERRRAMLESISLDCFCYYTLHKTQENEQREQAEHQSKADDFWPNLEMTDKEKRKRTAMFESISAHRLYSMGLKELKEKAERRIKADTLKADMEADKLFWEEEELKYQKGREETNKVMKCNFDTVAQQHARCQQMKACEVHSQALKLPCIFKDTNRGVTNNTIRNPPQAPLPPVQPKNSTSNLPNCWPKKARSEAIKLLNVRNNVKLMERIEPSSHNYSFTELSYV